MGTPAVGQRDHAALGLCLNGYKAVGPGHYPHQRWGTVSAAYEADTESAPVHGLYIAVAYYIYLLETI